MGNCEKKEKDGISPIIPFLFQNNSPSIEIRNNKLETRPGYFMRQYQTSLDSISKHTIEDNQNRKVHEFTTKGINHSIQYNLPSGKYSLKTVTSANGARSVNEVIPLDIPKVVAPTNFSYSYMNELEINKHTSIIPNVSGANLSFSKSGQLPNGLALNPQNGIIMGAPSELGKFSVTIFATNEGGEISTTINLNIVQTSCPPNSRMTNGVCTPDQPTCSIGEKWDGQNCISDSITCPSGSVIVNDVCETICPTGEHKNSSGECVKDSLSCGSNQHEENGGCVSNTRECFPENGYGSQFYNTLTKFWGACELSHCKTGFAKDGEICKLQTCTPNSVTNQSCSVVNGTGTQQKTCNSLGTGTSLSTCYANFCNSPYVPLNGSCVISKVCSTGEYESISCSIKYGTGIQKAYCKSDGSGFDSYEDCKVDFCEKEFANVNNTCRKAISTSTYNPVWVHESSIGELTAYLYHVGDAQTMSLKIQAFKPDFGGMLCDGTMSVFRGACGYSTLDPSDWGSLVASKEYLEGEKPLITIPLPGRDQETICYRVQLKARDYCHGGSNSYSRYTIGGTLYY